MQAALHSIIDYTRSYYDAVFRKGYFIGVLIMLAIIISINYSYSFYGVNDWWQSFALDYLLYLIPFSFAWILQWIYFKEDRSFFLKPWFWILVLVAPAIFAFRVNFSFHEDFARALLRPQNIQYTISVSNYIIKVIVLMLPVVVIWYLKDRRFFNLYGFSFSRHKKLYFFLLGLMIPFVLLAATLPDFLDAYPKALRSAGLYSSDGMAGFLLFELAYGLDFLSIEFFFRGFLIMAFIRYCGMRAIIPAACFYCCIHLGKPMAEAISSFFGGLLLGIISYHTLSIWGGLIIHLGIAWLMELAAYTSHYF